MAGQMKAFWDATGKQVPALCCSVLPPMSHRAQPVSQQTVSRPMGGALSMPLAAVQPHSSMQPGCLHDRC